MAGTTRERILDAALGVFAAEGFSGTTITEVERRAGLTPGTGSFYRHFPSKEALLAAAVEREVERCMSDISEARRSLPDHADPLEQQTAMLRLALRDLRRFDRLLRLALTEGDRVPELRSAITKALSGPEAQARWEEDPTVVIVLAALGGYHVFSQVQGHPFQGVDEEAFVTAIAALTGSL